MCFIKRCWAAVFIALVAGIVQADEPPELTPQEKIMLRFRESVARSEELMEAGKYAEAIKAFNELLGMDRNFGPAHLGKGHCFAALKEYELAIAAYSNAIIQPRGLEEARAERAKLFLELERYVEALEDYRVAVEQDPGNAELLLGRGVAQLGVVRTAAQMNPATAAIHIKQALASMDRAIEIDDDYALAYFERGMARMKYGDAEMAKEDLKRAALSHQDEAVVERLVEMTLTALKENAALRGQITDLHSQLETKSNVAQETASGMTEVVSALRDIHHLLETRLPPD